MRLAGNSTQTAVYVTSDGGNTWTLTPTLISGAGKFDFLSVDEAVIYNGEQFYVTRDAAQTWTTIKPNLAFGNSFADMNFANLTNGWVITADADNNRTLYKTTDGGVTWLPVAP